MVRRTAAKFLKRGLNEIVEIDATAVVLGDKRFQRPDLATKRRLLELLDVKGKWTARTFDLIMTSADCEPINLDSVGRRLSEITLIEVKSTRAAIRDASLSGFFFGATETEYQLATALGNRFRYAFVVLNSKNIYGAPFFVLLSHIQVESKTRTRRVQFQVNLRSDMHVDGSEEVYRSVPTLIAIEAIDELDEAGG